jgi:hypothetical protein
MKKVVTKVVSMQNKGKKRKETYNKLTIKKEARKEEEKCYSSTHILFR